MKYLPAYEEGLLGFLADTAPKAAVLRHGRFGVVFLWRSHGESRSEVWIVMVSFV